MNKSKLAIILITVLIVSVNLLWLNRWDEYWVEDQHLYRMDRLADQLWLRYHGDSAIGYMEIPLFENKEMQPITGQAFDAYVQKHAFSGLIVDLWRTRDRMTFYMIAINGILLCSIPFTLLLSRFNKRPG